MPFSKQTMAARMRSKRAEADLTMGELSKASGVSVSMISSYEDGSTTPGIDKVFAIAEALGCTPNDLCGFKKAV